MVKWFLIVVFAHMYTDGTQDTYMFTDPVFESKQECLASATDADNIQSFVAQLGTVYGNPLPKIQNVVCVREDKLKDVLKNATPGLGKKEIEA